MRSARLDGLHTREKEFASRLDGLYTREKEFASGYRSEKVHKEVCEVLDLMASTQERKNLRRATDQKKYIKKYAKY